MRALAAAMGTAPQGAAPSGCILCVVGTTKRELMIAAAALLGVACGEQASEITSEPAEPTAARSEAATAAEPAPDEATAAAEPAPAEIAPPTPDPGTPVQAAAPAAPGASTGVVPAAPGSIGRVPRTHGSASCGAEVSCGAGSCGERGAAPSPAADGDGQASAGEASCGAASCGEGSCG